MKARDAILFSGVILLLKTSCSRSHNAADDASKRPVTSACPSEFTGVTGVPLGTLASLVGVVARTNGDEFTLQVKNGARIEYEISCLIEPFPSPPKRPKLGAVVIVKGYESVSQMGFDKTVADYVSLRTGVLSSLEGTVQDPPGGWGKFRFQSLFHVLECASLE